MAKPRCLPVELWYVHCAVCSVGFSLNSLLLWLILRRTNKELKRFARILLCTNVMDLFYVLWAFFVDWRSHFRDGIYFAVINGYLSRVSDVPLALKFTILAFNGYWLHTMLTFVAVPFAYRYLVFCRQVNVTNAQFGLMMAVALAIPLVQPLNSYVHFWPSLLRTVTEQKVALSAAPCEDPGQLPLYVAAEAKETWAMASKWIGQAIAFTTYVVIVGCSVAIYRCIRRASISQQVRRAQRQLTVVFGLQALTSLSLMLLPHIRSTVNAWFAIETSLLMSSSLASSLIPIFSAVYTILFIGCYRRAVFAAVGMDSSRLFAPPRHMEELLTCCFFIKVF
ncbi:7TM GPCR protein [Aphelenchoides avenae]|nr:7TM GPCR protein [Aphelenchus avenae]